MADDLKIFIGFVCFIVIIYICGYMTGNYKARTDELNKQIERLQKAGK
jgi:hypothetical protein